MNPTMKKRKRNLEKGVVIKGRWHRERYRVLRLLGSGTVGSVYLCKNKGRLVALKISEQAMSISAEVQTLKMLQETKVQDSGLGPYLLDVDDWELATGKTLTFYAMEYVDGLSLASFFNRNGWGWFQPLLLQLLEQLEQLHRAGYVFGDLKSENILVTNRPPTLRLIDVGGITKMKRSVKEYTNFFDRAYWRLGSRLAEPTYDLFAVTMVVISLFYPKKFTRVQNNELFIRKKLLRLKWLQPYAPVFLRALDGRYSSARAMHRALAKRSNQAKANMQAVTVKSLAIDLLLIGSYATAMYFVSFFI